MKKLLYIVLAFALIIGMAIPTAVMAGSESEPDEFDLYAGQNILVGKVQVWNGAENVCVKYVITDPDWALTEIHLAIETSPQAIPQTQPNKKGTGGGNPIPGHFEFYEEFDPADGITEAGPYCKSWEDLGADCGDGIYIAAHAVVELPEISHNEDTSFCIVSNTDTVYRDYGSSDDYAPAVAAWVHPSWESQYGTATPFGATWIWNSYETLQPINGEVVEFRRDFLVDGLPSAATLQITADNGYEAYINEVSVGSAQVTEGWKTSNLTQAYVDRDGWQTPETWDITIGPGSNNLLIYGANEYMGPLDGQANGTIASNPGAIAYKLCVTASKTVIDRPYQEETAWGGDNDFPGANWATYIVYQPECEIEFPEGGTATIAFEDLPLGGNLDWDYNDWVADIETVMVMQGDDLKRVDFTISPEARGAGYNHVFHLEILAGTFGGNGNYELTEYIDGVPNTLTGAFDASVVNDFTVISNTTAALPGSLTNTIEPTDIVSHYPTIGNTDPDAPQHQPYVATTRTATLSIVFDAPYASFDPSAYDPYSPGNMHGEGLFFNPYLHVINTGNDIDQGDVRMLTVPTDWMWPEAGVGIWLAYEDVTEGNPPTFSVGSWWENYNDLVYNGKP